LTEIKNPTVACLYTFNQENSIAKTILKTKKFVDDIIVCDDGSTDLTGSIANAMSVYVIRHSVNLGFGPSLKDLFEAALQLHAVTLVTIDTDGQDNPDEIPKLLERLRKGDVDIVVGSRLLEGADQDSVAVNVADEKSNFRAYNARAVEALNKVMNEMGLNEENLLVSARMMDLNVVEVPVPMIKVKETPIETPVIQPQIPEPLKSFFMRKPLLFFGLPGTLCLLLALGFGVWALQVFLSTSYFSTGMVLVISFFALVGLLLVSLSLILWVLASFFEVRR